MAFNKKKHRNKLHLIKASSSFSKFSMGSSPFLSEEGAGVLLPTPQGCRYLPEIVLRLLYNFLLLLFFNLKTLESLTNQGSTFRPVGSPMRLDLVRWRLTFHFWSPVWPPRFQVNILFYLVFHFLRSMTERMNVNCKPRGMHKQCNFLSVSFTKPFKHMESRLCQK